MKVLILNDTETKVNKIELICRMNGAESSVYRATNNRNKGLTSSLEENDLILVLWNKDSRNNYEVIFSTGYCIGHGKPFVIYTNSYGHKVPLCNGSAILVSGNKELGNFILEEKERYNTTNIAIRSGHINIAAMLIDKGADINTISGDRGNTSLMDAAAEADIEILTKLLDAGAELNLKSKSGQTALVLAVGRHAEDAAIALISAGADINIKDDLGMTAKKYAELFKMERVLELINKGIE